MAYYVNVVTNVMGCSSESRVESRLVIEAGGIIGWSSVYAGSPTQNTGYVTSTLPADAATPWREPVRGNTTHKLTTHSPGRLIPLHLIMWP
jgi:hypothetical protein